MFKKTLISLSLIAALSACQSTPSEETTQKTDLNDFSTPCMYPDEPTVEAPRRWICGEIPASLEISATGYAKKSIAGMSVMAPKSEADARTKLGQAFESQVSSVVKNAVTSSLASSKVEAEGGSPISDETSAVESKTNEQVTEYFEQVTKSLSSVTLKNARVLSKHTSPAGGLYTLIGMDQATYDMNMNKIIKKAEAKDAELWSKFNNKKTAEALAKTLAQLKK
jgi:hypothetical protein